jgi:hypothetical protein
MIRLRMLLPTMANGEINVGTVIDSSSLSLVRCLETYQLTLRQQENTMARMRARHRTYTSFFTNVNNLNKVAVSG